MNKIIFILALIFPSFGHGASTLYPELHRKFQVYLQAHNVEPERAGEIAAFVMGEEEDIWAKLAVMQAVVLEEYQAGRYLAPERTRVALMEKTLMGVSRSNRLYAAEKDAAVTLMVAAVAGAAGGLGLTPTNAVKAYRASRAAGQRTGQMVAAACSSFFRFFRRTRPAERVIKDLRRLEVDKNSLKVLAARLRPATPEELAEIEARYQFAKVNVRRLQVLGVKRAEPNSFDYGRFVLRRRFGRFWPHEETFVADHMPQAESEEIMSHFYAGQDERIYAEPSFSKAQSMYEEYAPDKTLQPLIPKRQIQLFRPDVAAQGFVGTAVVFGLAQYILSTHTAIPEAFLEALLPPEAINTGV